MAEPITLHFNVFQAGAPPEPKRSITVDDPGCLTVGSVKEQYFSDALQEQKSVRFITGGRILDDKAMLSSYNLGKEASIMVSISGSAGKSPSANSPGGAGASSAGGFFLDGSQSSSGGKSDEPQESIITLTFVLGMALFVCTAAGLHWAYHKRLQFSMQTNQFVFISASVWAYAMIFHGLPGVWSVLLKLFCSVRRQQATARSSMASAAAASTAATAAAATAAVSGTAAVGVAATHGATRAALGASFEA